jgi:hypothetical protein
MWGIFRFSLNRWRVIVRDFIRVSLWTRVVEDAWIDCEIDFLISSSSYHQELNKPLGETKYEERQLE